MLESVTAPALLGLHSLASFNLLKIDNETSEKALFSEAADWIGQAQLLMVETHSFQHHGSTDHAGLSRMESESFVRRQFLPELL